MIQELLHFKLKAHSLIYGGIAAFGVFITDIVSAIYGVLFFVALDTVTGFLAAPKRGQTRNSRALSEVIRKLTSYFIAVISLHVLEVSIMPNYGQEMYLQLAKLGCTIICGLEIYSIFENLHTLTGLRVFRILTQFSIKKIEEKTGVNISEEKAV